MFIFNVGLFSVTYTVSSQHIRHICKQKNISGSFHESLTRHYLRLVGIFQTCRFQNKSFLKFLLSKEKDVDNFDVKRRKATPNH
jgi:hypothetical protein